jgi:hypothetical protein
MKIILSIIITFLIAIFTSMLLDWNFINANPVRYILVIFLIILEIITGFFYVKSEFIKTKS